MTPTALPLVPPPLLLQGIRWQTYQQLVNDLESEPGKRLTYDQDHLEIMTPLPIHEQYKSRLGRLVEVFTEEYDIEILSLGSTTWSRPDLLKGLEADECYYLQNEPAVRGKTHWDLTLDPPPDLAIEVDITSHSLNRLAIYAALGVPEVWQYNGKNLTIYYLLDEQYHPQTQSQVLPPLTQADILHFITLSRTLGETTWIKTFRQWIRQQRQTESPIPLE